MHIAPTAGQPVYFQGDNIKEEESKQLAGQMRDETAIQRVSEEESEPRAVQMRDIEKAIREIDKVQD